MKLNIDLMKNRVFKETSTFVAELTVENVDTNVKMYSLQRFFDCEADVIPALGTFNNSLTTLLGVSLSLEKCQTMKPFKYDVRMTTFTSAIERFSLFNSIGQVNAFISRLDNEAYLVLTDAYKYVLVGFNVCLVSKSVSVLIPSSIDNNCTAISLNRLIAHLDRWGETIMANSLKDRVTEPVRTCVLALCENSSKSAILDL
jgi:hypothetical protein